MPENDTELYFLSVIFGGLNKPLQIEIINDKSSKTKCLSRTIINIKTLLQKSYLLAKKKFVMEVGFRFAIWMLFSVMVDIITWLSLSRKKHFCNLSIIKIELIDYKFNILLTVISCFIAIFVSLLSFAIFSRLGISTLSLQQ